MAADGSPVKRRVAHGVYRVGVRAGGKQHLGRLRASAEGCHGERRPCLSLAARVQFRAALEKRPHGWRAVHLGSGVERRATTPAVACVGAHTWCAQDRVRQRREGTSRRSLGGGVVPSHAPHAGARLGAHGTQQRSASEAKSASRFACCLPPADRIDLQRLLPHAPAASSTAHAAECPPSAARWSAVHPSSSCASFAHSAAACRQLCSRSVSPSAAARRRLTAALSAGADTVYTAPHWSGWQSAEMGCTCTDTLAAAGSGFGRSACAASAVARRSCPRRRVAARREAREDIAQHTTAAHQGPAGVASVCIC